MEESQLTSIEKCNIKPAGEKEQNVWLALDSLYIDDKLAFKSLTISRILMKRAFLEDGEENKTKGDAHGIGAMKSRWARARGINSTNSDDQNLMQASRDPLLRASQLVRDEIKESLEEHYQNLIDDAEGRASELEGRLEQLQKAHDLLKEKNEATDNKLSELEPLYKNILDEKKAAQAAELAINSAYEQLNNTFISAQNIIEQNLEKKYQAIIDEKDSLITSLEDKNKSLADNLKSERQAFLTINENQRTEYMQSKIDLDNQIINLKKTAAEVIQLQEEKKSYLADISRLNNDLDDLKQEKILLEDKSQQKNENLNASLEAINNQIKALLEPDNDIKLLKAQVESITKLLMAKNKTQEA